MTINVKLSLCKITRASKLFQRNYYLPLLKPLSPKDALRRKIITGQNVLGARVEHYIPVLTKHEDKLRDKRNRPKGAPIIKKRVKRKESEKYMAPFLDDDMENHSLLQSILSRKGKEKDQFYIYEVPDKNCTLVISNLMEKAIKDKDIIDLIIAQRSEKIILRLNNGKRVNLPLAKFNENGAFYRGSGWTKEFVEEDHHHGKDTMGLAKLFEAKEAGIEDWELEMMRLASKRKKKVKGEDSADWKLVMQAAADNMDWDQFEEETKQIIEEVEELVEEENIPMAVDDMDKTKNVNEKLKAGGAEVLQQLPEVKEIPEVIKLLETGDLCELQDVSGLNVTISSGKNCFVAGQLVKGDESEVFMPGQTIDKDDGGSEFTPGITVLMDDEPSLIPGLVFGEEEQTPTFLPGESTITEEGQLQFEATEADRPPPKEVTPPPKLPTPPPPPPRPKPVVIEPPVERTPPVMHFRPERQPIQDCLESYEERRRLAEEEERKRFKERNDEKILKAEGRVDSIRYQVRMKLKNFKIEGVPDYVPLVPVEKSKKLRDLEKQIESGEFEDERTKQIMEKVRKQSRQFKHMDLLKSAGLVGEFGSPFFAAAQQK